MGATPRSFDWDPEEDGYFVTEDRRAIKRSLRVLTTPEVFDLPEPEWLLKDYIQRGGLTVVYGEPGSGKSLVMIDWANLLAAPGEGWTFAGHPRTQQCKVVYIVGEGYGGIRRRLQAWRLERSFDAYPNVNWVWQPVSITLPDSLETTNEQEELLQVVLRDLEADVVFVDTLAATFGAANENQQADMNRYMMMLNKLRENGAAVVIAHHNSKGSKDVRGSTVLKGAADTVVRVEGKFHRESSGLSGVSLKVTKQKDGEPVAHMDLIVNEHIIGSYPSGDDMTSVALGGRTSRVDNPTKDDPRDRMEQEIVDYIHEHPGCAARDVTAYVKGKTTTVLDVLNELIDNDYVDRTTKGLYLVEYEELEEL